MPPDLVDILREHQAGSEDFVCTNKKGNFIRPDNISHAWAQVRTRLGLPEELTFHDLRLSITNWLAEEGVNIKTVSRMLGHPDERITLSVYRSITKNMQDQAAKALTEIASLSKK